MQPILVRREFFIFHRTVPLQDFQIVCAERVGNLLWKDFVVRMTDNLFGREMKQLFKAAVGKQKPAVGILDIDDRCGVIGHVLQELLAATQRVLCMPEIRHALEGAGHTGNLAGLVPDGLAARAEPLILSGFGEEPVFHVIGITAVDMGRQGCKHAVGILGMKPGSPAFQDVGEFLVGITQHGFDARRPPHRCARRTPRFVGKDPSIPEAVTGALNHEFQTFFARPPLVFHLLAFGNVLRNPKKILRGAVSTVERDLLRV